MRADEENINVLQNKIWYVIKGEDLNTNQNSQQTNQIIKNENDFAELKLNDIIKLGRVKYVITEVKLNGKLSSIEQSSPDTQVFELIYEYNKQTEVSSDIICKICLQNIDDVDNPLVNLCRCAGSMLYCHYLCLKLWMGTKLSNKENEKKTVYSHNMKSFNCEICKTPYPLRFRFNNKYFDLIDCTRPSESNYIILESLNQLKDNNNYKSIHIISLNENDKIIMGRGHDSDVRINDISVSRTHACLSLINKKIILKDLKSKFGTLSLIQNQIEVTHDKKLSLQIGRTYAEFHLTNNKELKTKEKGLGTNLSVGKSNPNITTNKKQYFQVEKFEKFDKNDIMMKNKDDMDID